MGFKQLDNLLRKFTETTVPGCACVIMKDGDPIYEGYHGYADIEEKKPIGEHSIFRQASTTKLFTYAIMMQLYEGGEFLLSDPLYEYLPEWKNTTKYVMTSNKELVVKPLENPITIMHALTMACGLPDCHTPLSGEIVNPTLAAMSEVMKELCKDGKIPTLREEVEGMSRVPVMFEPGTHWQYGFGSEIVGALVEVITGKSVRRNMLERIIEPLGLQDTATLLDEEMFKRLVGNYAVKDGEFIKMSPEYDKQYLVGSVPEGSRANLNASCKDFATFMMMLANGGMHKGEKIVGKKSIDLMRTNYLNEAQLKDYHNEYLAGYGYGLGVRMLMDKADGNSNGSIGAFGWTGGTGIWAEADPSENIAIVYMHNTRPNQELYHHLRVRTAAYGCL
jgi:CubicO group peptidase (beta-lactamase class C family)